MSDAEGESNAFQRKLQRSPPMSKKAPISKSKIQKRTKIDNKEEAHLLGELLTSVCSGEYLRRPAFVEALEKSGLVEYLTEAYKAQQIDSTEWIHLDGTWAKEKWEAEIKGTTERFKENLPAALFAAALIIATQASSSGSAWASVHKRTFRRLAEFHFLSKGRQLMVDGRGRKPKIEYSDIYSAIIKRGADASRKGVAFDLGVSEKTLNNWRIDRGYSSWKDVVKYVLEVESKTKKRHKRNNLIQ